MTDKGIAFLIIAFIEVFLVIGCFICGSRSAAADAEDEGKEENEMEAY